MSVSDPTVPARGAPAGPAGPQRRAPWSIQVWMGLVLAAGVLATTAAAVYGFTWTAGEARDKAIERMSFRAERAAAAISRSVSSATTMVVALAARPGLVETVTGPAGCLLQTDGTEAFPTARLDVVAPPGRVACSSAAGLATDGTTLHAGSAWLDEVSRSTGPVVVWGAPDAVTGQPVLVVATPIQAAGGYVGAVAQFLSLAGTAETLSADLLAADHAQVTIVDRTASTVVATSERMNQPLDADAVSSWPAGGEWTGLDGSAQFFGSSDVPGSAWRVYVGAERSSVLAQARGVLWRQLLIGVLALLGLAAAVWVLNRRVARPLRAVTDAVVSARAGRGQERVDETGSAELATLAREFNAMLEVRSAHEAQLAHQATHDPITGLPNRVLLRERLARALRGGSRGDPGAIAVLHCRLLRFKAVSDGLGHEAGDRLLAEVADRLRSVVRHGDTLARIGDDEFVVVCGTATTEQGAVLMAERLQGGLTDPFSGFGETGLNLSAAIGIAVADRNAAEVGQLLREADTAMRHAEQTGRSWSVFQDSLHQHADQRLRDEEALRRALTGNELVVWYQPLHNVATGALVGAEALVRWQHPQRGLVPPNEFIPLAEQSGQILALGHFVLREACRQAAEWVDEGFPLRVSVNVAVEQLHDPDFPRSVGAALVDAGLPADLLCLEITESSIMTEIGSAASVLDGLRDTGVHVAIDDFGTGYSSLSYLPRLPVSELKIDRSFINRLGADTGERHLVKAIIAMAAALELTVVAEGVETIEQLETLADLHCDLAQGYLLGKPLPAPAFLAHLLQRRPRQPAAVPRPTPAEPSSAQLR